MNSGHQRTYPPHKMLPKSVLADGQETRFCDRREQSQEQCRVVKRTHSRRSRAWYRAVERLAVKNGADDE